MRGHSDVILAKNSESLKCKEGVSSAGEGVHKGQLEDNKGMLGLIRIP